LLEQGGDAALVFDRKDHVQIAEAIRRLGRILFFGRPWAIRVGGGNRRFSGTILPGCLGLTFGASEGASSYRRMTYSCREILV
jgi:hypothetical protein